MDAPVGWSCERGAVGRYGGVGRLAAAWHERRRRRCSPRALPDGRDAGRRGPLRSPGSPGSESGGVQGHPDDFLSKVTPRQVHGRPERLEDPPAGRPQGRAAHARAGAVRENLAALGFVSLSLRCHLFLSPTWLLVSWTFSPLRTSRADSLRTLSLSLSSPHFSVS